MENTMTKKRGRPAVKKEKTAPIRGWQLSAPLPDEFKVMAEAIQADMQKETIHSVTLTTMVKALIQEEHSRRFPKDDES
jgi:hypothetical protein